MGIGYKFLTPNFLKVTPETAPETAPDPNLRGSGWESGLTFQIFKPTPETASETAPNPEFLDREWEIGIDFLKLQKPLLILNPDPDFFAESHSRFYQKFGNDLKMKFRSLVDVFL